MERARFKGFFWEEEEITFSRQINEIKRKSGWRRLIARKTSE